MTGIGCDSMMERLIQFCHATSEDRFCQVASRGVLLDFQGTTSFGEFLERSCQELACVSDVSPALLLERIMERERDSSTVVKAGIAIPHVVFPELPHAFMLLARSRGGILFPGSEEPVHAVLMLVEGSAHRYFHLQALQALSRVAHNPDFMDVWMSAREVAELRDWILETHRSRCEHDRRSCM